MKTKIGIIKKLKHDFKKKLQRNKKRRFITMTDKERILRQKQMRAKKVKNQPNESK